MTKLVLAAACCLSLLSLARADDAMQAPGAGQGDQMQSSDGMQKKGMQKDGSMQKDGMQKDGMQKDGMQKDGMQKDDAMHKGSMSKSGKKKPHSGGKDESNWKQLGEGLGSGM